MAVTKVLRSPLASVIEKQGSAASSEVLSRVFENSSTGFRYRYIKKWYSKNIYVLHM